MTFEVHVLGNAAARPYLDRPASAVVVKCGGTQLLLDCGEGTLLQLEKSAVSFAKLDAVCITHMHGDHIYGLPGLITTLTLAGRTKPLTLIGPMALRPFLEGILLHSHGRLGFPLHYVHPSEQEPQAFLATFRNLVVHSHPLQHRIPATGFCVSETSLGRRLKPGVVKAFDIPYTSIAALRQGEDLKLPSGEVVANAQLTTVEPPLRTMVYLTDTAMLEEVSAPFQQPNLLFHDATFLPGDEQLALQTGHSTSLQAAAFAKTCGAQRLVLTHLSARYQRTSEDLNQARVVFPQTDWAIPGSILTLPARNA